MSSFELNAGSALVLVARGYFFQAYNLLPPLGVELSKTSFVHMPYCSMDVDVFGVGEKSNWKQIYCSGDIVVWLTSLLISWVDWTLLIDGASGVIAQQSRPALDLDSVPAFLVVKSCIFFPLWKQASEQESWNIAWVLLVQKP